MRDIADNAGFNINDAMREAEESGGVMANARDIEHDSPFPTHVLPKGLESFVRAVARSTSTDPSMVATYLWPALGSAIGLSRTVYPPINACWKEPPLFYAAVVAESGTGKSPVFDAVFRPHEERQHRLCADHERLRGSWEHEDKQYRSLNQDERKRREPPQEPVLKHILTSDATTEGVLDMLKTSPRGILVRADELSGWLASMDAYRPGGRGSKDRAFWLDAHGGRQHKVDRKTRGSILIPRAGCCVAGGIQPAIFKNSFDAGCRDSGLLARFLLALPPECARELMPGVPTGVQQHYDRLVQWLLDIELTNGEGRRSEAKSLPLSGRANACFKDFVPDWDRGVRQAPSPVLRAAGKKLEGGALRFALVLRLVDEQARIYGPDDPVELHHLEAGITLARWYFTEAERVYALWNGGEGSGTEVEHPALMRWRRLRKRGAVDGIPGIRATWNW